MLYVIGRQVDDKFVYLREDWKTQSKDTCYSDDLRKAKVYEGYNNAEKECGSDEIPLPMKWEVLKKWLEKEAVQKYEEANGKTGIDQISASCFARGLDEVLIKMQSIERL